MSLALVLSLALAANASASRLGVAVLGDDSTSQALLGACPALAVFRLPDDSASQVQIASYKTNCLGGKVVVQVGGKGQLAVDPAGPAAQATSLWASTWLAQAQAALGPASGDFVEGPTEFGAASPQDLAAFWDAFATVVTGSGYRPVVGGLAPGLPASVALADGGSENAFCATLRIMASRPVATWAWSHHALAPAPLTQDLFSPALDYRIISQQCAANGVPASTTVFLTEAGRESGAWQASDFAWLQFLDGQLRADGVLAAVFEAGGADVSSLAPVAGQFAAFLANPQLPDGGVPDGGAVDGGPGGVVPGDGTSSGGPLVPVNTKGCSFGSPGATALVILPVLFAIRRRRGRETGALRAPGKGDRER